MLVFEGTQDRMILQAPEASSPETFFKKIARMTCMWLLLPCLYTVDVLLWKRYDRDVFF